MDETITYAWAPIEKAERQEDGSVIVTGVLTDAGLDRDGQAMSQEWLDQVVPKWYAESGNIREQHDPKRAAGVGIGLVRRPDGAFVLQSRVVDPVAALKCLPGPGGTRPVYQGYSIGVREPRLSFEKAEYPGGLVVGGYICESSLADRPSNPRSLFMLAKADGPDQEPEPVGKEVEPHGGQDGVTRRKPKGHKEPDGDEGQGLPGDGDGDEDEVSKTQEPELTKDWAEFDAARKAGRLGSAVKDKLPGDSSHSMRVGDIAATHHNGKTIIGRVKGFEGSSGSGGHVLIEHEGGLHKAPREQVTHLHVAEPPKATDQGMGEIKGAGLGEAHTSLSPEKHLASKLREQHAETEALGRSALGEGMFAAAIRQAEAAAARRAAAGPAPAPKSGGKAGKVKGKVKGAAHWVADELAGAHDVRKAEIPDLLKFVSAKRRARYAESGVAMPNGDFPIPDHAHLTAALRLLSRYKGDQAAAKAHIKTRAKALGVDIDLDSPGAVEKLAAVADLEKALGYLTGDLIKSDGATAPNDTDEVEAMDKTELGAMIAAAVTDGLKGVKESMGEQIAALVSRVEKVEAAPAPGGPAVTRAPGQTLLAKNREVAAVQEQIADLDRQAALYKSEDPQLSQGYREMANDLRAQITRS